VVFWYYHPIIVAIVTYSSMKSRGIQSITEPPLEG